MFSTLYIEEQIADHPRTRDICARFPQATQVRCERYGEVFNPRSQDFRLQKQKPALILAHKHDRRVPEAPEGYGIGGRNNYYFSHMLNCLYDCRYCFLQGMYRSAHYVLYVNYEDFGNDIDAILNKADNEPCWFFSGYDCDSLGPFRLPRSYFKNIVRLYPDEPLFAGSFAETGSMISYPQALENEMTGFCTRELLKLVPETLLFPCRLAA